MIRSGDHRVREEGRWGSRQKKKRQVAGAGDAHVPWGGGELEEAAAAGEDDERDLGVAQQRQLVRLLEQPVPALGERHLPADLVLDPLQLHLAAPHPASILAAAAASIPFLPSPPLFLAASSACFTVSTLLELDQDLLSLLPLSLSRHLVSSGYEH